MSVVSTEEIKLALKKINELKESSSFELFFKQEIYDILKERKIIYCEYDEMSDDLLKAIKDIWDYSYAFFENYLE